MHITYWDVCYEIIDYESKFLQIKTFTFPHWFNFLNTHVYVKDTINTLQLLLFTDIIRGSKLPLWVGYFIYLKFTCVSSIIYQSLHLNFN